MKPITVTTTGKQFATSTTAAATVLPFDSSGYYPKAIWVSATVPTYVKLTGPLSATAVAGDLLVQPADPVYLICQGYTGISALTVSGTGVLNVAPAEIGSWGDGTSLSLAFTSMTSLDSRITFTRADATSCATYFDSTGRLQTAAANVARFDYDPSTVAGVTGGELLPLVGTLYNSTANSASFPATFTSTSASNYGTQYTSPLTVGKTYQVTASWSGNTSNRTITFDDGQGPTNTQVQGSGVSGSLTGTFKANSVQFFIYAKGTAAAGESFTVNNISVKEVTFSPKGLLIEESRTNLLLQSRDMTNASWTKTDVTPTRNQVGIDGTANSACLMTEGSAGTAQTQQNGAAVTAGSTITASVVLKRGNTDWVRVIAAETALTDGAQAWFNLNTGAKGTVSARGAGTNTSSTIANLGGGWYRCSVTATPNGTFTVPAAVVMSALGDTQTGRVSGATYIVDAAQLEVGSFATSPIITTAATVTRAPDSASMTGSNFSSWFNASAGTFVGEYSASNISGTQSVLATGAVAAGSFLRINAGSGASTGWFAGGVGAPAVTANATHKRAIAYTSGGQFDCSTDGSAVLNSGSSDYTGTANALGIGMRTDGAQPISGWIRRLTYYPTRLTNAQLQSLTT